MQNIYEAASSNKRKSAIIIVLFIIFVTLSVYLISQATAIYWGYEPGGIGMAGLAFIVSGLLSFGGYYFSDSIVLGISGARPAERKRDFHFYTSVENLCIASGLPKPKLYVIEDSAPNAFATGRNPEHAVICATTGLLEKLSRTELEGVVAHELTHIGNYDTLLMSITAVLVGTVALLGDWLLRVRWRGGKSRDSAGGLILLLGIVFAILSPIIAQLIQLAISRRREFMADAGSVSITRQPQGLISALEKISSDQEALEAANKATAHLYIVNPFKGKSHAHIGWFAGLFNTHPPIEERLSALKSMA
ncbi:zinc metalloprotease HtpX [Candidatus Woesebacteria bacterium GWA1_41_8]|uniref:Protease HtpX homolog n=1 Tax=Candidatus Woesebacteria bacterium GWA1_41_8 TaxID=1802471 RepID=A0A1F7WH63_9BACT|nr:MAG: zinc metalloprotease HtpX [Candidatus Woesebacteria bacterium GWA1_41_8]